MSVLPAPLRRQLERAARDARNLAEAGARKALEALAVHEPDPYRHMSEAQRDHRSKLQVQAKQLGDGESTTRRGSFEIKHLVEKLAYDQWHRLLFARFLLQNNLLISPEHGVSVSLDDCEELAPSLGLKDAWAVAARFAANELPEIFRADDPAGAVELAVEDRNPLIQLVIGLPVEVFTASDSLGWCYQFWQAERKDEVNAAGNRIGADELPAVTQLFTEDYMVDFLLDNTLGAWHAGKVLSARPTVAETAQSEDELRSAVALPGCPWKYLRFIKAKDGKWMPGAGTFDGWPKTANALTCLDPCMGSGHFVVAMFERLVALRIDEEQLDEAAAVAEVIKGNLFGLEIDPRCTQIGAFNLALAAWRRVGHCKLPAMNLACSGLAPNAKKDDWLKLAGDNEPLQRGMERLYGLFKDAPLLGSLISPRAAEGDLLEAGFHELQPLLEKALSQETKDDTAHEMAVTARGLAKAADILTGQFTLVATNVPYLGRGSQDEVLKRYCERAHPDAKSDLAACFIERCLQLCARGGEAAIVTPQSWLFLVRYRSLRESLLKNASWSAVARLGSGSFETISGEVVNTALVSLRFGLPEPGHQILTLNCEDFTGVAAKSVALAESLLTRLPQQDLLKQPDFVFSTEDPTKARLSAIAEGLGGITTGDSERFRLRFWEIASLGSTWRWFQGTVDKTVLYGGRHYCLRWERGEGALQAPDAGSTIAGRAAWDRSGVSLNKMGALPATIYSGDPFENVGIVISVTDTQLLPAVWYFCESGSHGAAVRRIDKSLGVTCNKVVQVPFDLAYWQKVAKEKYPHGLPKPYSSDPTQWLLSGHPRGSDQPLQVAVARLLGYQWPRQTGSSFPDCPALKADGLEKLADEDGIVCLSATRGEVAAAERLRELLARAWGKDWNATVLEALLSQAGHAGKTLDDWLRNGFFEQHCALFHHRPFIWHIWDGHKNGFSALVNYHQLTLANLEKLTYAYLGDWVRRQQAAVEAEEAGSDARLEAARQLQARLKLVLEGEPPYDIFVRWKPLSKQAIGWHPDIDDGVRMNIRPFAIADILRKRVKIKWDKDRGKEPDRDKKEFPWFWGWDKATDDQKSGKQPFFGTGTKPDGNRWNDCHFRTEAKQGASKAR